jgi:hypothetical protein
MPYAMRRARRAGSLAALTAELLNDYNVPLPTHAVRILLNDSGRHRVTAEHLSRLAAYERDDFLRTRMPPRLCSVIDTHATRVRPRWWACGEWRLQRRILTEDAKLIWLAVLGIRLCEDLSGRDNAPGGEVRTLALGTIARLIPERDFFDPLASGDWLNLRRQLVDAHPGATHTLEGPTSAQHDAEETLKSGDTPAVDLYFGRSQVHAWETPAT